MRTLPIVCGLALFASGCVFHVGTRAEDLPLGKHPAGSSVTLYLRTGGPIDGELLAVSDSAVLVLGAPQVVLVPFPEIRRIVLPQQRYFTDGLRLDQDDWRDLQLVARYPQGVDDGLLARLLARQGQAALRVVGR